MKQEGSENKKRISFLMPYIDFCFMLIIIFVGMLSIAYFEPPGSSDIETKNEKIIDRMQGQYEKTPVGVQEIKTGVGEKAPTGAVHVLARRPEAGKPQQKPSPKAAAKMTGPNAAANKGGADQKELERLKKELEKKNAEIQELEKHQGVPPQEIKTGVDNDPGNSYYIDLRRNNQ
jgi:hypothetical protein